jgi:dihydroorotate dehydrogenase (fumarate)
LSTPAEIATSLRWVSLMAQKLECDIAASTGVHDGTAVIKQLLAGATVVQLVSAIYEHGNDHIGKVLEELESWMDARGYADLAAFRGKMSQDKSTTPAVYERVQFMKQFGK